jgi:hypothetical protein
MKRLYVALCVTLVTLPAANAESVLRTMVTTDIRGLMPGNSPDENTGLVLQNIFEGLIAWRSDGAVAPMLADFLALAGGLRVKVGTAALEVQSTNSSRPEDHAGPDRYASRISIDAMWLVVFAGAKVGVVVTIQCHVGAGTTNTLSKSSALKMEQCIILQFLR